MKECVKCNLKKDYSEFYKYKPNKDGLDNRCKSCICIATKERTRLKSLDVNYILLLNERGRERYHRLDYKNRSANNTEKKLKYSNKYPEKIKAGNSSKNMKPPNKNVHRHHWSYNDEHFKDVIWLKFDDHHKLHRFIIYDQEFKMYRIKSNNLLLNTKQLHIDFANYCELFL